MTLMPWNHREKCNQISTNKPGIIGSLTNRREKFRNV